MIGKFSKAGMDVSKFIPNKYIPNNETNQDFISYPTKNEIYLPPDSWNDRIIQADNNIILSQNLSEYDKLRVGEIESFEEEPQFFDQSNLPSKESNIISEQQESIKSDKVQVSIVHTINDNSEEDDLDNFEDDDDDDDIEYDDNEENIDNSNKVHVTLDKESVEISNENLDGLVSNFSERDSIKASIARMNEMNEMSNLVVNECPLPKINSQFLKPPPNVNLMNLPIQSLFKQSITLSHHLLIAISNQEIPFSNLCVNILVDCSCFISVENKMFNMLLICALTTALNVLSIPYSVAVFGDSNFKCVIKSFDEMHSLFTLQKILDCLFIKRFCSNLPTAVKFAIDNMEHDRRKQRAIFTFTSGLDDQIRLTKSWSESIFNKKELSFFFVFIKSKELDFRDDEYLQKVWKSFEADTKIYKALSNVKVASFNSQLTSFNMFIDGFISVMKRNDEIDNNKSVPFAQPLFEVSNQIHNIDVFIQLIDEKNKKLFGENNDIYVETTDVLKNMTSKIDRLDTSIYRNKLNQIIKSSSEKKNDNLNSFLKKFIENRSKVNQSALETIFKPNKASQTVLSNSGSDIDITALILNIINPVPDPLIYLEEKGGLIRNYGVSVIIDPSLSCLFDLSAVHTLLTIRTILSSFAALDIPCFDLIVSGNPQPTVLCSEVGTFHSLDHKSSIWESLFILLQNPIQKSDLASAINVAFDIKRMRSKDYTSLLFVITDGLYEKSHKNKILQVVNNCVQSGITVFGIGVGTYPKGIDELFPHVVFSPNPSLVTKCIASIFGDSISGRKEKMPPIYPNDLHIDEIKSAFNYLIKNEDKPIFSSLKEELSKIKHLQDAFRHYLNSEGDIGNSQKGFTNFEGENAEMYKRNTFQSQKILIVMLWDYTMNPLKESRELQMKYIKENFHSYQNECIYTAVNHFGIEIEVVQNYRSAIEKLLKQEKKGFCDYYSVWIMCGPPIDKLPDNSSYPNLVGQFIEVITQFWRNGGALVFWAEGEPLFYQVNLFLEKNGFDFKIEGNHQGRKTLTPDESNDLQHRQTFNRHPQGDEINDRSTLAHNLGKIFEGVTISYAKYDLNKIKPFIPFSRDSEGGISSMFLPSDKNLGTGDIVIDCGYTKCFANLTEDGTYRYIQNIAGWTMNMESHIAAGYSPKEWRPKAINYTINLYASWKFPMVQRNADVDIIFIIDATGSMKAWLLAAKNKARTIASNSRSKYPNISFNFGAIFYKDPVVQWRDRNVYYDPTSNIDNLVYFMSMQSAGGGGGDGPEDWAGAYDILLNQIRFRPGSTRAVIHIADAEAHGSEWGGKRGVYEREGPRLTSYIRTCARSNIYFSGINIGYYGIPTFNRVGEIYAAEGKRNFYTVSQISRVGEDLAGNFLQNVADNLISSIAAF